MSKVIKIPKDFTPPKERRTVLLQVLPEGNFRLKSIKPGKTLQGMQRNYVDPPQKTLGGSQDQVNQWINDYESDPLIDTVYVQDMR